MNKTQKSKADYEYYRRHYPGVARQLYVQEVLLGKLFRWGMAGFCLAVPVCLVLALRLAR